MEDLLIAQHELVVRISRTWENLKKNGQQNTTIETVRNTIKLLDAKWARLEEQHNTLLRLHRAALKDNEYITEGFLETAEWQYIAQRSQLQRLEQQFAASSTAEAAAVKPPTTQASAQASSYPRLDLPKFSGRFEDWPAFRDLFTSMVVDEVSIPNVRKLHYLKTSVLGEAESLLRNLPTTEENFQRAWTTLTEYFENKRLLVRAYLNSFTAIQKMRLNSQKDLRNIIHGVMTTIGALEGIGRPLTSCEDLFVHLVIDLLDQPTRREWDKTLLKSTDPPSLEELQDFLKQQLVSEDAIAADKAEAAPKQSSRNGRAVRVAQQRAKQSNLGRPCPVCNGNHFIAACEQYKGKPPQGRKDLVSTHNRCYNCLGRHAVSSCNSSKTCQTCSGRHHSSLHDAFASNSPGTAEGVIVNIAQLPSAGQDAALLATARVWVNDAVGRQHPIRAMIDPGAETALIAESLAQRLRLPRTQTSLFIRGIEGKHTGVRGRVTFTISARDNSYSRTVSALVFPKLLLQGGSLTPGRKAWSHVQGLPLADPEFAARDPVELLLGAQFYGHILMSDVRRGSDDEPVAQQTRLGWILLGGGDDEQPGSSVAARHCSLQEDITETLRRFWEWEEPPQAALPPTEEERQGEVHFSNTFERLPTGRFQVRLPFRDAPSSHLATTRRAALRMLDSMERRFARDDFFRQQYDQFMGEYEALGHMTLAPSTPPDGTRLCYLPHHGILKGTGDKPKLRVVFNGSARTASGLSLNDHLLTGPNLLPPLPDVILRWRRHQYAFVADIEKMYRQIVVHPADRDYQRVLWKHDQHVREYILTTLTYGTACAPFLAMRVIQQLAQEEETDYPNGAAVLRQDMYVDDILSGASSVEAGRRRQQELSALCMAGGFPLRKWASNHPGLLEGVPHSHRQASSIDTELPVEEHSVLGVRWRPAEDLLTIGVTRTATQSPTKRSVLSQIARLFDPLGWLAPVVIKAKILLQSTWLQRLEWDTPLAAPEAAIWQRLMEEIETVEEFRIPRWFTGLSDSCEVQVHGFADASERAYGAVVYLRIVKDGKVAVSLVQAKSKVAPLKQVSLPRLELCAATLLSKLSSHIREVLGLAKAATFHWTDSTVTLAWIRSHPSRWTTYVANRVAEIHRESHSVQWRHVPGKENPADCVSRGLFPRELSAHPIRWHGPSFLQGSPSSWTGTEELTQEDSVPEERPIRCLAVKHQIMEPPELTRFSSLQRLLRVTAWMMRWSPPSRKNEAQGGRESLILHPQELEAALFLWVRIVQKQAFAQELQNVREGRPVQRSSSLAKLTPFLDREGLLRVGGRLGHAAVPAEQRHPIILVPDTHLSRLIVDASHRRTLHGGTQATLASIRQRFWLPRGRQLVKGWIHRCPRCIRWRAATPQPIMADLPKARVTPSRPFLHTGVDFAGPIRLRTTRGRGHRTYKGFICVFVCFSTRAVHLEVVSDYTSAAFLAAFRRFTSRRGLCVAVYSDRGTNFTGADSELKALFSKASPEARRIAGHLADEGVRWAFNPPAAPHFGGLWEAAVRSVKYHLRRVIGESSLTFEEMATLLAEVEACLNSRPLQALTDDADDLTALTPGHFLVGEPLTAIPEPSLLDVPQNRLTRWKLLQNMRDHLWARWSQEYVQALTPRAKWWTTTGGLQRGQLCIVKNEQTAPTRWPLGRITRLHTGKDGQVRVAEVKTASGVLTRPVIKLVPLPGTEAST